MASDRNLRLTQVEARDSENRLVLNFLPNQGSFFEPHELFFTLARISRQENIELIIFVWTDDDGQKVQTCLNMHGDSITLSGYDSTLKFGGFISLPSLPDLLEKRHDSLVANGHVAVIA